MLSLLLGVLKKSKGVYHKSLYALNYVLYRDCRAADIRTKYYKKFVFHRNKLNDNR